MVIWCTFIFLYLVSAGFLIVDEEMLIVLIGGLLNQESNIDADTEEEEGIPVEYEDIYYTYNSYKEFFINQLILFENLYVRLGDKEMFTENIKGNYIVTVYYTFVGVLLNMYQENFKFINQKIENCIFFYTLVLSNIYILERLLSIVLRLGVGFESDLKVNI